jgi:hypothetical protein
MANAIPWHGQNKLFTTPKGEEKDRVLPLPVFNNGNVSVSCWQLTKEELADIIQNNGKIYLAVFFGNKQPPVFVGSEDNVRSVVLDFGHVWKKEKA